MFESSFGSQSSPSQRSVPCVAQVAWADHVLSFYKETEDLIYLSFQWWPQHLANPICSQRAGSTSSHSSSSSSIFCSSWTLPWILLRWLLPTKKIRPWAFWPDFILTTNIPYMKQMIWYSSVAMWKPKVRMVVTFSPYFSLYRIVFLPGVLNPTIRKHICLLLKRQENREEMMRPMPVGALGMDRNRGHGLLLWYSLQTEQKEREKN